jgi:transposase-like protein
MDGMVKGNGLLGDGDGGWLRSGSRRRRWSAARKAVIVAESLVAGAKVSEVAARHGVNANMLSAWRGQVSAGGMSRPKSAPISSAVTFAPVKVVAAGPQSDARADLRPAAGAIEIMLGDAGRAAKVLSPQRLRLNALLSDDGEGAAFTGLTADPGRVGLESLLAEIAKLDRLRALKLAPDLLRGLHPDLIARFRRRATVETAWELRRHPEHIRLPLLAFFCVPREAEVVDGLVELLIQVTHRITVKAERRVIEELVAEAQQVRGKAGILFRVAEAAVGQPDGVVREVIFPVAGEQTFEALVRGAKALGTSQNRRVHTAVRASYGSWYRRMMPKLLDALDFRSNNGMHRPLLDALLAIRRAEGDGRQYFPADEITIDGVVRPKWRDIVIEDAPGGGTRVNRINYEICVLQTLRERLRCKEIWVVGANRFRNPDDDLPADFAMRRAACYENLGLPTDARVFTDALRTEMSDALAQLNKEMPRNPGVRLDPRRDHPIVVSPLEPQPVLQIWKPSKASLTAVGQ